MMKKMLLAIARRFGRKPAELNAETANRLRLLPQGGALSEIERPLPGSGPKAGIVIVSYFALPYLRQCLDSVLNRTAWPDFRVVVVDNGSDAETLEFLRSAAKGEPRLTVIENGLNLGFAAANNLGLKTLDDCEFLVLLNNDTVVPPGWLGGLIHHAAKPEIGLAGPVTNWTGNEAKIETSYTSVAEMERFAAECSRSHAGSVFDIDVPAMFCVAFRREVFARAGCLDERYGMGMFEDVDYSETVRDLGYRTICCEDVFVHHYGMASFSKLDQEEYDRLFNRNRDYFEGKWKHRWEPHKAR